MTPPVEAALQRHALALKTLGLVSRQLHQAQAVHQAYEREVVGQQTALLAAAKAEEEARHAALKAIEQEGEPE